MKTVRFSEPRYLGDPINIVKIFNEKEPDELIILDIEATIKERPPDFKFLSEIVSESFVPLAYGGGIRSLEDISKLLALGIEKVVLNTAAFERPELVKQAAERIGSQSVVVCMDVKHTLLGQYRIMCRSGRQEVTGSVVEWAAKLQDLGAGELVVNAIDRDGMMRGYDLRLLRQVSNAVIIPVVAAGGAGSLQDLRAAVVEGGAAAAGAGSLFVYQGVHRAVLINFPDRSTLRKLFV